MRVQHITHFIRLDLRIPLASAMGRKQVFLSWGLGTGGTLCLLTKLRIYEMLFVWTERLWHNSIRHLNSEPFLTAPCTSTLSALMPCVVKDLKRERATGSPCIKPPTTHSVLSFLICQHNWSVLPVSKPLKPSNRHSPGRRSTRRGTPSWLRRHTNKAKSHPHSSPFAVHSRKTLQSAMTSVPIGSNGRA